MKENQNSNNEETGKIIIEKASKLIEVLHPPQKDMTPGYHYALFPFDHETRKTFDYFAPSSQLTYGLPVRYMNPVQRQSAMDLLQVCLTEEGFKRIRQVHMLEDVLSNREKERPFYMRDSQAYYFAVYGTPASQGSWSWRCQGHHLSLQWTFKDGKIISSTPQFIGAQPALVTDADLRLDELPSGTRVLGQQEDLARDLIESLSDDQQRIARGQVQWDIETTNVYNALTDRKPNRLEDGGNGVRGVLYKDLSKVQQDNLQKLVREHTSVQLPVVAQERLDRISTAGWDGVRFYFIHGFERGDAFYYRLRGNTFLIEYLNKAFSKPNERADHQHSVWRDFSNDWGIDHL